VEKMTSLSAFEKAIDTMHRDDREHQLYLLRRLGYRWQDTSRDLDQAAVRVDH
jgi:hypothetical protein